MISRKWLAAAVFGLASGTAFQSFAAPNILYILDASNSMWGQIDGTAKIETARDAMTTMLDEVDPETSLGLMVYGHRSEGACDDIQLIAPLGSRSASQISSLLLDITPRGKTPIAGALTSAASAFSTNDAANHVVLISDGIETCDGDPCAVAGQLASGGIQTRVHAIGFDVDAGARAQLECIAEAGNGSYFDARNADEFRSAVTEATQVAQAEPAPVPEPEPEPTTARVFFDDFEGDMSEEWAINSPNPDGFIVEDGNLLIVSSALALPGTEDAQNMFVLNHELPDGDWDAYITLTGEFKTNRDSLWFGLWKDTSSHLGAQLWTKRDCCGCSNVVLRNLKASNGETTQFDTPILGSGLGCGSFSEDGYDAVVTPLESTPIKIGLHKRGRSYSLTGDFGEKQESGEPIVYEVDALTSLRSPGDLSLLIGKWDGSAGGEMLVMVDSVEILSVSE